MNRDEPLAFFITWTVYGTFLQGDGRWWRKRRKGEQPPQPRLAQWHHDRLNHSVLILNEAQRQVVVDEIARLCEFRGWHLWEADARTNHVHIVITATGHAGSLVRDQMKANCTRALREGWPIFLERPIWTVGGDWQCINTEDELERAILYVSEAQDRKGLDE
jgi:REP element-mobilizing transposase RayT